MMAVVVLAWIMMVPINIAAESSKPITIRISHAYTITHLRQKVAVHFRELADKYIPGRLKVEIYPAGQLFGGKDEMEAVMMGSVEMVLAPDGELISYVPAAAILKMPIWKGYKDLYAFEDSPKGGGEIAARFEKFGVKCLGYNTMIGGNMGVLTNKKRPIHVPEDAKGLKIRVPVGKHYELMIRHIGASPIQIGGAELMTALQTGVVDGSLTSLEYNYKSAAYKLQPHLTLIPIAATSAMLMNLKFWNSLPADVRSVIETKIVPETIAFGRKEVEATESKTLVKLKTLQKVVIPTEEETNAFLEAWQPVIDFYLPKIGQDIWIVYKELGK
jgi:C4-dicarboxylate-binding protein DctP